MLDRENIKDIGKIRLWRGFGAHTWLQMRKTNVCASENKVAVYEKKRKTEKGYISPTCRVKDLPAVTAQKSR